MFDELLCFVNCEVRCNLLCRKVAERCNDLVQMSQSSDKPCPSRPADTVFTRKIQSSDQFLRNAVGRDSGLGSTLGAASAGPASISTVDQSPESQQTMIEACELPESESFSSSFTSQQTVRAVQPPTTSLSTAAQLHFPVEQLSSMKQDQSKMSQSQNTMPLSVATEQPPSLGRMSNKEAAGNCETSLSSNEPSFLSDNDILFMNFRQTSELLQNLTVTEVSELTDSKSSYQSSNSLNVSGILDSSLSMSAEPSDADLDSIKIEPYEFKEEFREKQYDIVLIYSENDRDQALAFRDILTKFIVMEDNKHPSICVLDQNAHLTYINSRFTHMEEALKRSTFMFLFITKDFCGDSWAQLQRDECLMESIDNPDKKWCVVPILTRPRKEANYALPFGLRALKGVEIYQMLCGKTLSNVNMSSLQEGDVDPYFCNNMRKMLSTRLGLKKQRERQQLVEFQRWLKEEKQRRWKVKQEEELKNFLDEIRQAQGRAKLQEELEARKQQELALIETAAAQTAGADADQIMKNIRINENLNYHPANVKAQYSTPKAMAMDEKIAIHHHHYHDVVNQNSDMRTIYKIQGPISDSTFGDRNKIVKSCRQVLDQTNLETDTPEDIEYEVEVEATPASHQPEKRETVNRSVSGIADDFGADYVQHHRPTGVEILFSTPEIPSADPLFQKNHTGNRGELIESPKCSPEVDNPQSPSLETVKQNVQPVFEFTKVDKERVPVLGNAAYAAGDLSTLSKNVLDVGVGLDKSLKTSRSVSSDSSSERPVAAVAPIRQTSETVANTDETAVKLPFSEDRNYGETMVKSSFENEETNLKQGMVQSPLDERQNEETAKTSQFSFDNTKQTRSADDVVHANAEVSVEEPNSGDESRLSGASVETFVVVNKHDCPIVDKKMLVQTDGCARAKPMMSGLRLPKSHAECSSLPAAASSCVGIECTENMSLDENLIRVNKSDKVANPVVASGPNSGDFGRSNSSSSSTSSPAMKNKSPCTIS